MCCVRVFLIIILYVEKLKSIDRSLSSDIPNDLIESGDSFASVAWQISEYFSLMYLSIFIFVAIQPGIMWSKNKKCFKKKIIICSIFFEIVELWYG